MDQDVDTQLLDEIMMELQEGKRVILHLVGSTNEIIVDRATIGDGILRCVSGEVAINVRVSAIAAYEVRQRPEGFDMRRLND